MYDIIRTNYAWVSVDGFLLFCRDVTKIDNWDTFTKDELEKLYDTVTAHHKIRANLNFLMNLGLIIRINSHYKINEEPASLNFFQTLREGKTEEATYHLSKILESHPFFQKIINDFFYDKKNKSTKELKEFLRELDNNKSKVNYYRQGSRFFSKFLDKLEIVDYNQRTQIITLKGKGDIAIQKSLVKEKKQSMGGDVFNEILNDISLYIKTVNNSEDLAKVIEVLPTEKRIKINSKLLEIVREK